MFCGPALDHDFLFGIELYRVAALAVLDAEEAVFPSAEREIGHGRGHADVDADVACRRFVAEAPGCCAARRKQRRLIAVGTALQKREGFVEVIRMDQA